MLNKKYGIFAACLFTFAGNSGYSGEWSGFVSGELRAYGHESDQADQEQYYASLAAQPEYYLDWSGGEQQLVFTPFLRIDQHDDERTHFDVRELYWAINKNALDLRIGIRKVFWGVTESQHLVDIINQTDLVESPDGEEKLGQPMFNFSYVSDWGTMDVFVMPYFRERTFAGKAGRLRTPLVVDTDNAQYESSDEENNIDLAIAWEHSVGDWDLGLNHFSGTSRDPRFIPDFSQPQNPKFIPYYDLIEQTGISVQATKDRWLWKFEGIRRDGQEILYHALTAGLEYTFFALNDSALDLGIVAEYLYDDRGSDALTPFEDDVFLGVRLAMNDEQSTEALFGVIKDVNETSSIYSVEASRRIGDSWKLNVEARLYQRIANDSLLASFANDDYVQIEMAYYF